MLCVYAEQKENLFTFLYHIGQEEYCILSYCFVFSFLILDCNIYYSALLFFCC